MAVWMVGVDHTRADIDVRSAFSFTKKKMEEAYEVFRGQAGLLGSVILSTCNRMEWWLSAEEDFFDSGRFAGNGNIGHILREVWLAGIGRK